MKVAFITGGTRGIGRGIAQAFAEAGYTVVVGGRKAPEHKDFPFFEGDVRDPAAVQAVLTSIVDAYGRIDVVVNNAGGSPAADTATASPRFSEAIVRLNLLAPLYVAQAANAFMLRQEGGGVIVNVASVAGLRGSPTTAIYGAAKAGLLQLTRTLAIEWAPKVRVNAVTPGLIATPEGLAFFEDAEAVAATVPLQRFGAPADVAGACVFLASDAAAYISGANLVIDGGGEWPAFLRKEQR